MTRTPARKLPHPHPHLTCLFPLQLHSHPIKLTDVVILAVLPGLDPSQGNLSLPASPHLVAAYLDHLAAVRATANARGGPLGDGKKQESAERASWRGRVDLALLSVLRDGLLRRSEAHLLTWSDVEFRKNGTALLQLRRSKTDQEGEGVVLYIGKQAAAALDSSGPSGQPKRCWTCRRRSSNYRPSKSAAE